MSVTQIDVLTPKYGGRIVIVPPLGQESLSGGLLNFDKITADELICPWISTQTGDLTLRPGSGVVNVGGDVNGTGDLYCEDIIMSGSNFTAAGSLFFDLGPGGNANFDGDLVGTNLILTSGAPTISTNAGGIRLSSLDGVVTVHKSPTEDCKLEVKDTGDFEIRSSTGSGNLLFNGNVIYPLPVNPLVGPTLTLTGPDPRIKVETSELGFESFDGSVTLVKSPGVNARFDVTNAGDLEITTTDVPTGKLMFNGLQVYPYTTSFILEGPRMTLTGLTPTVLTTAGALRIKSYDGMITFVKPGALTTTTITTDAGSLTLGSEVLVPGKMTCGIISSEIGSELNLRPSDSNVNVQSEFGDTISISATTQNLRFGGDSGIYFDANTIWGVSGIHPPVGTGVFLDSTGSPTFDPSSPEATEWTVRTSAGAPIFGVCNSLSSLLMSKYVSVYGTANATNHTSGAFQCSGGMSTSSDFFVGGSLFVNNGMSIKVRATPTHDGTVSIDAAGSLTIQNNSPTGDGGVIIKSQAALANNSTYLDSNVTVSGVVDLSTPGSSIKFQASPDSIGAYYSTIEIYGTCVGAFPGSNMTFWFSRIANIVFISWKSVENTPGVLDFLSIDLSASLPAHFRPNIQRKVHCEVYNGDFWTNELGSVFIFPSGMIEIGPTWDYVPELNRWVSGETDGHAKKWNAGPGGYGIRGGSGMYAVDYPAD